MRQVFILLVKVYQWTIAPVLPPTCRFMPSCSQYMIEALQAHGAIRGTWLGVKRVFRCHPWCEGGVDPVPLREAPRGAGRRDD